MQEMVHNGEMLNSTSVKNNPVRNHEIFITDSVLDLKEPYGIYVGFVKPCLDVLFSVIFLLLSLPISLAVAILIKLDSEGPVLFKQQRYGKYGKVFWIYKFRTMYAHVPNQGRSPVSDQDYRITQVGRFLRKTSLDEIPQLINILLGEMSFIGPRPEQVAIVEAVYTHYESQRLIIKPGITGLWQVSKDRMKPIQENLHHDFNYIGQVSFLYDCQIIYQTIKVIIKGNGC